MFRTIFRMTKKPVYAFICSFVLMVAVIILTRLTFSEMRDYTRSVDHAREVISNYETLSDKFKSAQLYSPTYKNETEKKFYEIYKADAASIGPVIKRIKTLVTDNTDQAVIIDTIDLLVNQELRLIIRRSLSDIIESANEKDLFIITEVNRLIKRAIETENSLLKERAAYLATSTRYTNWLSVIFSVIAVVIIPLIFIHNIFIAGNNRRLEDFLSSILNTSQNAIIHYKAVWDKGRPVDFIIEYANKALFKMFEFRSEDLIGKRLNQVTSYAQGVTMMEKYMQVMMSGEPVEFEYMYQRGDVKRSVYASLARTEDGITASFYDLTALKQYENELKANIKTLEQTNAELEQYAYAASHDLQEPLRKIRSFGSFLQDTQAQKMDEKGREQLEKIMSSAERMSSLIKDILSFSSLKKEDLFINTDLNIIIAGVREDLDLLVQQKGAAITTTQLPVVYAIPLQMTQLFFNLINNALKFSKPGTPTLINISSGPAPEEEKKKLNLAAGPYYKIIVQDNGIGFNPEYADQIFGLFKRLNDKKAYPGSGIGLSLCKKVVHNHGGEIIADSKEREGAAFYIFLPALTEK